MSRGSKLSRAIEFFESADIREARVAFQLVKEVMEGRLAPSQPKLKFARKARARKSAADTTVAATTATSVATAEQANATASA